MNALAAFAWMVSLMIAPHTLALLGNAAGALHAYFPIMMVLAAMAYWVNAKSLTEYSERLSAQTPGVAGWMVTGLSLSGRWITALMLSTVLLVTAGFAFNEIFLYWFPNFAFAYIMLGTIIGIHLLGRDATRIVQVVLITIVLIGLGALLIMGLWQIFGAHQDMTERRLLTGTSIFPAIALIFVGFDLALVHDRKGDTVRHYRTMLWGITAMAVILGLWGWVSLQMVSAEKLSTSFIPHISAARAIGGQAGRMIMGAVVIAGSAAAVSALLSAIAKVDLLAVERPVIRRPSWLDRVNRPASRILIAGVAIVSMMASGMAGTEIIDSYIRAGLIVWILSYASIHFFLLASRVSHLQSGQTAWYKWTMPAFGAITMLAASVAMMISSPDRVSMLKLSSVALLFVTSAVWVARRRDAHRNAERISEDHRPYHTIGDKNARIRR